MTIAIDRSILSNQMRQWSRDLRIAAEHLELAAANGPGPSGTLYNATKAIVDGVADEMYAANDAMARAAWEQIRQQRPAS